MKSKLCARCRKAARKPNDSYCVDCRRAIDREWKQRANGAKPRKAPWRELEDHEKFCPGCGHIRTKADFSKNHSKKDGLMSHCKTCDYFKQVRYQIKNRDRLRPIKRLRLRQFRAANPGWNARVCRRYYYQRKAERLGSRIRKGL